MKRIIIVPIILVFLFIPCCIDIEPNEEQTTKNNFGYYELEVVTNTTGEYSLIVPILYNNDSTILENIKTSESNIEPSIIEDIDMNITFNNRGLKIFFIDSFKMNYSISNPWSLSLRESTDEWEGRFWVFLSSPNSTTIDFRLWAFTDSGTSYNTGENKNEFILLTPGWNVIELEVSTYED